MDDSRVSRAKRTEPPRYVVISPCRDEAEFARLTLDSVVGQTIPPTKWIIVDDGSTDETPKILDEYAKKYDFIQVLRHEDRGCRKVGPGVIEAFYAGLELADLDDFDYLCKLDLDLELPLGYFEDLISRMETDPRLGTCSGKAYFKSKGGTLVRETIGDDVSLGMTKFFRINCFRQIGGFVREVMWDGIDCHRCRMLGWKACSWNDPELRFIHLRPMGSSQLNIFEGRKRHGRGQYFMGSSLAFMTASAVFRVFKTPALIGSLGMLVGFIGAALRRDPRYPDLEFRSFLRKYQSSCLFRGKQRARQRLDREQEAVWDPNRATDLEKGS